MSSGRTAKSVVKRLFAPPKNQITKVDSTRTERPKPPERPQAPPERATKQQRFDLLFKRLTGLPPQELRSITVLKILEKAFPEAQIFFGERHLLDVKSSVSEADWPPANLCLPWEDEEYIKSHPCEKVASKHIRALISIIPSGESRHQTLTVATMDLEWRFDDIDMSFMAKCTLLLRSLAAARWVSQSMQDEDKFLRGITHHMRLPLDEILVITKHLRHSYESDQSKNASLELVELDVIMESGRQLHLLVDGLMKYNEWHAMPAQTQSAPKAMILPLDDFEAQTIEAIIKVIKFKWSFVERTCVYFERHLTDDVALVMQDKAALLDCLVPLLLNALQHTENGSVVVRYSTDDTFTNLVLDVKDTGSGVSTKEQEHVFDQERKGLKGDVTGLVLARKIAKTLNGTVELVTSSAAAGSLFRITLRDLTFACPWSEAQQSAADAYYAWLPPQFCLLRRPDGNSSGVRAFMRLLECRGLKQSSLLTGNVLAIVPYTHLSEEYEDRLTRAQAANVSVSLYPNQADVAEMRTKFPTTLFFSCPFTTTRMKEILAAVNQACKERG